MKKLCAVVALSLMLPAVWAGPMKGHNPERRLEHLSQELSLTPEQQTQAKALFEQAKQKHEAIQQETHTALKALLSAEQLNKLEQMKANHPHGAKGDFCPGLEGPDAATPTP